jgi:DnaJ-class molecular chaperone
MNAFDFARYSSTARTRSQRITCPFQTLGLPKQTEYKVVKKQFLKLALQHHPDTASADKDDKKAKAAAIEMFMRVRKAFEQIIELDNGMAGIRSDSEKAMDGEEFNKWFYGETGKYAPDPFDLNLSPETLQEVAEASATQAGLDRYDLDY